MSSLPLSGLRILEFSHAVLGPACGLLLADFGAEVIKVEPIEGDPTRRLKGFGMGYFPMFNRNKKSLAVNIKTEAGQAIIHRLLATADGLVENFGPGTMARLGFGYEQLAERYPRLIYTTLKGFLPGPYEQRTALDEVVQMMSGLAYMTGPPGEPLRAGASIIDITTGIYGALGMILALQARERTGQGQLVQGALFETAAFLMGHHMAYAAASQEPVPPMPVRVSAWAIYHQFTVAGGERVFIGVTSDRQWERFCHAFDRPDLLAEAHLATNNGRIDHRDTLLPDLRQMLTAMDKADVLARCETAGVPFSPIARPEDLFNDPQLVAGGSLLETILPNGLTTYLPRQPVLVGDNQWPLRSHPPAPGTHTTAILQELGYSDQAIAAWRQEQVIQ